MPLKAPQPGRPLAPHALPLTPPTALAASLPPEEREAGRPACSEGQGPGAEPGHCLRGHLGSPPPPSCRPQTGPCCGSRAGSGCQPHRGLSPLLAVSGRRGGGLQGLERRPRCLFSCRRRRRPRVWASAVQAQPCPALGSGCSEWGFSVGGSGALGQSPQAGARCLSASTPAPGSVRKRHGRRRAPRAGAGGAGGPEGEGGGGVPGWEGPATWSGASSPGPPG